jgi:glycosyltransferase involved in cell wall biosynthesis
MGQKPLISITTPCYNSVGTIERTIKSILAQDFKNYEYIIVDGGSTDGTLDIIRRYEPLFEGRMKWKSEPDRGLYDAFNKGIERSTGIYCWNVNSDDFIEQGALSVLANHINAHPDYPVISGAMHYVDCGGTLIRNCISTTESECFNYQHNGMGVNHPATLVPKDVYDRFGAFDIRFKICADIDWFNRIHGAGVPVLHIDDYIITMTDGGISNNSSYFRYAKDRWLLFSRRYNSLFTRYYYFIRWTIRFIRNKKRK